MATCDEKHQVRTTEDWIKFITSDGIVFFYASIKATFFVFIWQFCTARLKLIIGRHFNLDKRQKKFPVLETHHLVLYPVEPGIFIAYFIRPEDPFINLHSILAIYQAIFPGTDENGEGKLTNFRVEGKKAFAARGDIDSP
jgi:hypothetical protein